MLRYSGYSGIVNEKNTDARMKNMYYNNAVSVFEITAVP
jgi:hypothetical protein